MPAGSTILIQYNGTDITSSVLFAETSFEAQMAAMPGSFTVTVRDIDRSRTFVTGKELTLTVDGTLVCGGWVTAATRTYAFPADKTNPLSGVKSRKWVLTGVDYNILFDKRVLRNTSAYTTDIPSVTGSPTDSTIIKTWFPTYFDIPAGFDFTSATRIVTNHTFTSGYTWDTQGTKMRDVIEKLGEKGGSIYYINASKQLYYLPIQNDLITWGFSDKPNNLAYSSGIATRGFRDGEMVEDASPIANDALVWGGSQWAANGDVVFSRRENAASQTTHGRWQISEMHVGDADYKIQSEVTARAKVIVDGNQSGTFAEGSKGLVNPEKQFRCTWFSHDVPTSASVRQHITPGKIVPIELWVFSTDGGTTPFTMNLPLRQIRITFPELDAATTPSKAWVQFEGFFGVLMSDPYWLWSFLRSIQPSTSRKAAGSLLSTATNATTSPTYGAYYSDEPSPATNGVVITFTIPFSYIGTTLRVFVNGIQKTRGTHYTETSPSAGSFTMVTAPGASDKLWVIATLAG